MMLDTGEIGPYFDRVWLESRVVHDEELLCGLVERAADGVEDGFDDGILGAREERLELGDLGVAHLLLSWRGVLYGRLWRDDERCCRLLVVIRLGRRGRRSIVLHLFGVIDSRSSFGGLVRFVSLARRAHRGEYG